MNSRYILGIDTSNYKTSVAVIDNNYNIIYDARKFLTVKKGERGLRQSEALFQHIQNLPELIERIPVDLVADLDAVAWSNRPRPVEGSYMPVFNGGSSLGRSIASVNSIIGIGFSHQEGHIEAIKHDTGFQTEEAFIACHFSGGTTEILIVEPRIRGVFLNTGIAYNITEIGGTKDIAYGQVLDRAGVALGMEFPAGQMLDRMAVTCDCSTSILSPVKARNAYINLSGIDTQIKRAIEDKVYGREIAPFAREILEKLAISIEQCLDQATTKTGINKVIMAGGVSSSNFIKSHIKASNILKGKEIYFGSGEMAQDNAVGTAVLGGRYAWD